MIANISPSFMSYEDTLNTLKYADRAKQIKTVVKRNVLNVEYHISNYRNIINNLRGEIGTLRDQLKAERNGGNMKLLNTSDADFLPRLPPSAGTPKSGRKGVRQDDLKKKQLEMNIHFEKEATIRKKILELEKETEQLAFNLFRKELDIKKIDSSDRNKIEEEKGGVQLIRNQIDQNNIETQDLQEQLEKLERERSSMLRSMKNDLDTNNSIEAMYNQHLLNLKDMEFLRKEKQAQFHIKQKEMYIGHLKNQLALRDKIIKEKLGQSITNFLMQDIMTIKDIESMSHEILLPTINSSASKGSLGADSIENYNSYSDDNDYAANSSFHKNKNKNKYLSDKSPYSLPKIKVERNIIENMQHKRKYNNMLKNKRKNDQYGNGKILTYL